MGMWRLTKVLDSSDISSIDDKQAAKLVGKILVIQPDKVSLAGESCGQPDLGRHYEDTVRYLREEAHAARLCRSADKGIRQNCRVLERFFL
jgi:hypothetical protein